MHAGLGSRIVVVLWNCSSKHTLCDVCLRAVAAVFQFAEQEQTVAMVVRMKKINLELEGARGGGTNSQQTAFRRTS